MIIPAIHVAWCDDEQQCLLLSAQNAWAWADLDDAINRAVVFLDAVSHPIGVIFQLPPGARLPIGPASYETTRHLVKTPAHVITIVIVGGDGVVKRIINLARRTVFLVSSRLENANSIPEAMNIIQERLRAVNTLPPPPRERSA